MLPDNKHNMSTFMPSLKVELLVLIAQFENGTIISRYTHVCKFTSTCYSLILSLFGSY